MNTRTKSILYLFIVGTLCVTVACSTQVKLPSTPTNSPIIIQASPLIAPTGKPSQIPSRTITSVATPIASWTPLPLLTTEQADEKINDLILTNGGCQLPCWWGITPSQTTWSEAMHFLAQFSEIKQGGSGSSYEGGKKHYSTNFGIYYHLPGNERSGHLDIGVQDELVIGITASPPQTEHTFRLDQILASLGKPDQVYVSAQAESQTSQLLPARIILDYGEVGIWASYEFPVSKVGKDLKICPNSTGPTLELWDPGIEYSQQLSIEEYVSMITGFEPRKLEDVSRMSVESFSNSFQNPRATMCLDTPASFWP